MQIHCKKCGKDVTMETEFQDFAPYRIINNHKCEVKTKEIQDRIALDEVIANALEKGFIL